MSYQTSAIAAVVALIFLGAMVVVGLGALGRIDATTTPLIVTVLGSIASTVVALLAVIRTDRTVIEQKRINGDVHELAGSLTERGVLSREP